MASTHLRLHIFSQPRTGSNLFCKLFSQHPQIQLHLYNFMVAHAFGPEAQMQVKGATMDELRKQSREAAKDETYQVSLNKIEEKIANTEAEGKVPLLKDHPFLLMDSGLVQIILKNHREVAPKPIIVDHMLDLPPDQRNTDGLNRHSERPAFNPTVIPDRLMNTFTPVFIIRHPVRQIESLYRTAPGVWGITVTDPEFELTASYKPSCLLYKYYVNTYRQRASPSDPSSQKGTNDDNIANTLSGDLSKPWPIIVIDGDDLITDPERIANKFCKLTGLDPGGVIYTWPKGEWRDQGQPSVEEAYFGTLSKSEGIKADLYPDKPDLAISYSKWQNEWGDEVANVLKEYVNDTMADYEYLRKARL